MTTQLIRKLKGTNRESIRKEITEWFLEEMPGTGRLELRSVYHYQVENLSNGQHIVLRRPARLNKGFDFEVAIPGSNFGINRKTELPSHASIVNDLMKKRQEDSTLFDKVQTLIKRIYKCEVITEEELASLSFKDVGHPIGHVLKAIRWLFIKKDIIYWNCSGRAIFYAELENI